MKSTLLITSELTNQNAQKALFTCVVYTCTNSVYHCLDGLMEVTLSRALPRLVISLSSLIKATDGELVSAFLRMFSMLTFLCAKKKLNSHIVVYWTFRDV